MSKKTTKKQSSSRRIGGRPSKFDQVDQTQVEKLARAGWTDGQMADFFGVTERTWNNWKGNHRGFFQSLKDWKAEADHKVERSLYERATGYSHPEERVFQHNGKIIRAETVRRYPPDSTAMIFWLKNRIKDEWRDKQVFEHYGLKDATDEELKAALRQKLKSLQAQGIDVQALLNTPVMTGS